MNNLNVEFISLTNFIFKLELDGKIIELPHLESIVVLNISHWGGGVEPWSIGKGKSLFPEPRYSSLLHKILKKFFLIFYQKN